MDQIFATIAVCNLALERMFEAVAEDRWIALLHHDNLPHTSTENIVRWNIFESFSESLKRLYIMLRRLQSMNDSLFAMLQAQLRENERFVQFRMFQLTNAALWGPIITSGFITTVRHPMLIYQQFSANMHLYVTEMQGFCNGFSTQLEDALLFYNTEVFAPNTSRAMSIQIRSLRFSNLQTDENIRYITANGHHRIFRIEMDEIAETLHDR